MQRAEISIASEGKEMSAQTAVTSKSADRELVITRVFDAPRRLVFKAWTEPEHMMRWRGPKGFTVSVLGHELRPGGAYRIHMRSPEGTDHWLRGVYREIVEPERLTFTWAWEDEHGKPRHETLVTVTFAELDGKTRLTLHQAVFESVTACDAHRASWSSSLERLADFLASS
jgi:uncharacterized protein YndB with AHSA1/START domain